MSNTDTDTTRDEILENMARAFFACAWADYSEQVGPHYPAGCEILDVMPEELDPSAVSAAKDLAEQLEKANGATLVEIMARGSGGDRPCDAEHFGHYAAMQAMGHGVGLECVGISSHGPDADVKVPYMEYTYYDLDPEKYPT